MKHQFPMKCQFSQRAFTCATDAHLYRPLSNHRQHIQLMHARKHTNSVPAIAPLFGELPPAGQAA
eukprot:1159012-Pelagomonas_calceolata.AAC.9